MKRCLICVLLISNSAWADPIWHCSRNIDIEKNISIRAQENQFSLVAFNGSMSAIGISVSDLIDVYSGVTVRIGGLPLSACFMLENEGLTASALLSLGLQPSAIQALARKSSIIQSNLYFVTNEKKMVSCIAEHFPAVGYLDEPTNTDAIQPCF
jgi:hypothetical protein